MPFKVVQTIENGVLLNTYCPENWESGAKLFWPPSLVQGEKLKKKESSRPGNNWLKMDCVVLSVNLTLEQAQSAVEAMSDISETEEEESTVRSQVKKRKLGSSMKASAPSTSLNNLGEQSLEKEKRTSAVLIKKDPLEDVLPMYTDATVYFQETVNEMEKNLEENENPADGALSEKIEWLNAAVADIQENQKKMQQTLDRILKMVSDSNSKLNEFIKRSQSVNLSADFGMEMEPIDSKHSLIEFEEKLKDPAQVAGYKKQFVMVCGSGKGKGLNNCYCLVDSMFTRRFLTECSWSGGSRTENVKICFKSYERVFDFFYSLVRESDPTFTIMECKVFFKNILRNSFRRNLAKGVRTSAPKFRAKKSAATTANNKASTSVADDASDSNEQN